MQNQINVALWAQNLIAGMKLQKQEQVVQLLNPRIKIKDKDKLTSEKIISEISYHVTSNFQTADEQQQFLQFLQRFLLHSKALEFPNKSQQQIQLDKGSTSANEIFDQFFSCFQAFMKICEMPFMDGKWITPIVDSFCRMVTDYALLADKEISLNKDVGVVLKKVEGEYQSAHSKLEKALMDMITFVNILQRTGNIPPDTRKFGCFFLIMRIIKVQFKLNQFKNCERFFKWIDQAEAQNYKEEMLPQKWRVTISYYRGRYSMYKNDFNEARTQLRYAFAHCHKDLQKNKKKILKFLIPVEMNLNIFPTVTLLNKYQLKEYIDIADACMKGNMKKFEQSIENNKEQLIKGGVFLVVEKLNNLTLRNFFKNVIMAVQQDPTLQNDMNLVEKPHIIKIELLFHLLKEWDSELDLDELECLLANQIYLGFIRGYIQHEQRILVMATKSTPFPLKIE